MSDLVRAGSLGKGGLGGVGRQTRVERPRPLKVSSVSQDREDMVGLGETVARGLAARQYTQVLVAQVATLCNHLKRIGAAMETSQKDPMDRLLSSMVAACRDDSLDLVCRVHMLEIIELRSMGWQTNENVTNYYKQKLAQIELPTRPHTAPVMLNPAAPDFQPDRKDSPPSAPRKDSQPSAPRERKDTPPSAPRKTSDPPRTPLARPRPPTVRPPGGAGDSQPDLLAPSTPLLQATTPRILSATPDHSATLTVGKEQLVVSGSSPDLVRTAKIVLHEFFNVCDGPRSSSQEPQDRRKNCSGGSSASSREEDEEEEPVLFLEKPELSYSQATLLELARSPLCKETPDRWSELVADLPGVVRRADRAGPTSKLILREMEEIRRQEAAPKFQ